MEKTMRRIVETGKVIFGSKQTINAVLHGKAKAVVMAENAPKQIKERLERYTKMAKIPLITFKGSSLELGNICGRQHLVASLAIIDPGAVSIKQLQEDAE